MSTDNISGTNSPTQFPVSTSQTSSVNANTTPFANDSMGTTASNNSASVQASIVMAAPSLAPPAFNANVTLNVYYGILSKNKVGLQDALTTYDNEVRQTNLQMLGDAASWALTAALKRREMTSLFTNETKLYQNQANEAVSFNINIIKTYNDFLATKNAFTNNMYQLQLQFKAGTITSTQYNAQVDIYNAAVAGVNTQLQTQYNTYINAVSNYNAQIQANNAQIAIINAARLKYGIPGTLPYQTPVTSINIQLLPTSLPHNPPLGQLPSVPSSFNTAPSASEVTAISTTIIAPSPPPPLTIAEQALLNLIQQRLQNINNGSLKAYNNALAAANIEVGKMQNAISDFSQGLINQTTYNAAISTYLGFVNGPNGNSKLSTLYSAYLSDLNTYNSGLVSINAQIDTFNQSRPANKQLPKQLEQTSPAGSGLLPASIPSGPSPPAANPFDAYVSVILPCVPNGSSTPTKLKDFLAAYYTPYFEESLEQQKLIEKMQQSIIENSDFTMVTLRGKSQLAPNASTDTKANVYVNEQGSSPGISGVGLTLLIGGLNNSALTAIITNQLLLATGKLLEGKQLPPGVSDKILAFTLNALQETLLVAAQKAGGVLSQFPSAGKDALSAVLSAAIAGQISSLINSGAVKNAIVAYLQAAGISPAEIATIQGALTAAVNLGLLQVTVKEIATLLDLPGLLPQVLANLPSASDDFKQQILSAANSNNINSVVNNPNTLATLKSILNDTIQSSANLQSSLNQTNLNRAINNALNQTDAINSANDLHDRLVSALKQEGADVPTAGQLAQQAVDFVQSEQALANLDLQYANNQAIASSQRASQDVKDAVARAQNTNSFETNRQFRGAVVNELQNQGQDLSTSYTLANQVLQSQLTQSEQNRSIQNNAAFTSAVNSQTLLQSTLSNDVTQAAINQSAANQKAINQSAASQVDYNQELNTPSETVAANTSANASANTNVPNQQDLVSAAISGQVEKIRKEAQVTFFAALSATAVQNPTTPQQYGTRLVEELTSRGVNPVVAQQYANDVAAINGDEVLRNALVSDLYERNALRSSFIGDALDRNDVRNELISAALEKLQGFPNAALATQVATQLATLVVGPVVVAENKNDIIQNKSSFLDILDTAHLNSQVVYTEKTKSEQIDNYRLFVASKTDQANKTATNLSDFVDQMLDTAKFYIYSADTGIMYRDHTDARGISYKSIKVDIAV